MALPLPLPGGDHTVWADITPFLDAVCKDLQVGDLIHGENFSLFEAMSALEIMDPKMDAGITSSGFNSLEEAIQNGLAPTNLNILQTIDVLDHLLSCEATWHKGHTLAQTVFSCMYLLYLERAEPNIILHTCCRSVRTTCNLLRSAVSQARTHEEEDFFTMAFGLPLRAEGDEKLLSVLNAVEETISRQLRASKHSLMTKKVAEDYEPLQPDPNLEEGYCRAVLSRFRFHKHLYHILAYMGKPQGKGLEMAHKHIVSGLIELAQMRESSNFLSGVSKLPCKDILETSTTASGQVAIGFDPNINSRLLSPTPPRSIKLLSWRMALRYFEKLLQDLDKICLMPLNLDLEEIIQFIVDFQKSQPDLVARSYLQILVVQDGRLFGQDAFSQAILRAISTSHLSNNQEFQKEDMLAQLGQLLLNMLRILCTNCAWQRRKLGKCLQEWHSFLHQVEMIVYSDVQKCFSMEKKSWLLKMIEWTEQQSCWIALRFLMLGFELELYFPSELCMVYWYLEHILLLLLHYKVKEKSDTERERAHKEGITLLLSSSAKKKTKKKRGKGEAERERHLSQSILLMQCYMNLSKGLQWMLAAISSFEKSLTCPAVFNTEQERFIQTFELLQKSRIPEFYERFARVPDAEDLRRFSRLADSLSYANFVHSKRHSNFNLDVNYFETAQKDLKRLRHCYPRDSERLEEIRQLELVTEKNRIAMDIIKIAPTNSKFFKVSFEFTIHQTFPVAVIKRS